MREFSESAPLATGKSTPSSTDIARSHDTAKPTSSQNPACTATWASTSLAAAIDTATPIAAVAAAVATTFAP